MPASRKTSPTLPEIQFARKVRFGTAREREEALSLIQRLAVSARVTLSDAPLSAANLEPLNGGRTEARVFKLTPFFGSGRRAKGPPVVVKIAPPGEGFAEKSNYDQLVRGALPAACRPELLGFVRTRRYSGLCYSFVGSPSGHRTSTFTNCLQRGDAATVNLVLRGFFDKLPDSWYSPALFRNESDIAQRYLDHYFTGPRAVAETEAALQFCATRYFNAREERGRYVIGGQSFPSPRAMVFTSGRKRPYRSCILHGDLNSDNILIDEDAGRVAVIDFQKTGRGHVLEDLAAVEASIRINYVRDASFAEILEKERLIALGRRRFPNDSYSASIGKVRDAALRYFGGSEDSADCHFATAAIGLRLMQATDLSHTARARITASALWAAKALAGEL